MATGWHEQRQHAINSHAAAVERERTAATTQARQLLADFVREMNRLGVAPQPLRARVPDRRTTYRTPLIGWYLRGNGALAVDEAGGFYVLDLPPRVRSRLFGVHPAPVDPPLRVGMGARDGESLPLAELLRQRLAEHRRSS